MRSVILLLCFVSGVLLSPQNFLHSLSHYQNDSNQIWAVLVAGSSGWFNYRHQADICHSYQILHNHGIPDERIIVMMADDLARNPQNPTPGVIINHPNGSDVYKGVLRDYTGEDVTPENFMAVLKGNKKALQGKGSGKVLKSGPNDNVFIYFADHGAPGLIAFPESELTAKQLNKTLQYMKTHNKFKKMLIYIEACESGSMFQGLLPDDIEIYATTAANPDESSYACYFDDTRDTYLGDVYSVNWMEDSDKENLQKETLKTQFRIVKTETNTSHVQVYGNKKMGNLHISEFQGRKSAEPITYPSVKYDAVRSRDVPLHIIHNKKMKSKDSKEIKKLDKTLKKMIRNREFLKENVHSIVHELSLTNYSIYEVLKEHPKTINFTCYDEARTYFQEECFEISKNPYALEFMHVLINLCNRGIDAPTQKEVMESVCTHPPVYNIV